MEKSSIKNIELENRDDGMYILVKPDATDLPTMEEFKKELKDLAKDLMANDIELESFYGSNGVHYNLFCEKYSYSLQFGKSFNSDWKILAFWSSQMTEPAGELERV